VIDPLARRYVRDIFAELCRIDSPSRRERGCAERVIAELSALGIAVEEDSSRELTGSDCGNLLARIPAREGAHAAGAVDAAGAVEAADAGDAVAAGDAEDAVDMGDAVEAGDVVHDEGAARARVRAHEHARARVGERCVLLCAHLDTVPALAPIEPVLVEGMFENANAGILGADNKAAVAVLLALARELARTGAPVEVELLFTVCEEIALVGARAFDASALRSDFGYVFDHATPIGEVVTSSPSHFRLEAVFRGAAAHAGIRPEDGRSAILAAARAVSAMRLGRLDDGESSANVGTVEGGSAMNVVPERCTIVGEVRSQSDERAEALAAEMVERVHEAANAPECECDVDVSVQRTFSGYRLSPASTAVRVAEAALSECGFQPQRISSGGASDANALIVQGVPVVNLANGTERNHEPGERVSVQALEDMLEVALALLAGAAALPGAGPRAPLGAAA
jgi:tripeptide aminopeptidase